MSDDPNAPSPPPPGDEETPPDEVPPPPQDEVPPPPSDEVPPPPPEDVANEQSPIPAVTNEAAPEPVESDQPDSEAAPTTSGESTDERTDVEQEVTSGEATSGGEEEDDEEEYEQNEGDVEFLSHEDEDEEEMESRPSMGSGRRRRKKKKSIGSEDGEEEAEEEEEGGISKKEPRKRSRYSVSGHVQSELTKQKMLAARQAREARRHALSLQHFFIFEQLMAHFSLKSKDVEEFCIDSQVYAELFDKFFDKKGLKALLFVYKEADPPGSESGRPVQLKKEKMMRLMVTDGSDLELRGNICYFYRPNNDLKVGKKNMADELYFGVLGIENQDEPGSVLQTAVFNLDTIFIPYLKASFAWVTIPDQELADAVRHKFLTSIKHFSEFLADCHHDIVSRLDLTTVADMSELLDKYLNNPDKVLEAAKNADLVLKVENVVILWCKNIERVLALSKLMRKDSDAMGPTAELAYWRNLHAKMCFIIQQIQQWQFVHFIQVLIHSKSKVLRRWKDVDARVTDDYHESKDNVRYMYALTKYVEPLYQQDPYGMIQYIPSLIYAIQVIHTTSRYYNSCEKVTALLVKISNQMVYACRRFLTKDGAETIWSQEKRAMIEKLKKCLELYATYRAAYESTKMALQETPEGKQFNFSVNHIFGRYDMFCERLRKIITILEIFDMYKFVHESNIDGLESISIRLHDLFKSILAKTYDPLEFRQMDFDTDFATIRSELDEIQKALENFLDESIENCPTAMRCLELLERFANLRNRCLNIEEKQWYAFQFYFNEINMLKGIYESEKNDTPIPRGYPPFAGKIAWARHLFKRLERPMLHFQEKTNVLERDDARPVIQAYNGLAKKLIYYEIIFHDAWVKQSNSIYDSFEAPLLTLRGNIRQELVLNFDPFFRQLVDETEIIRKLDLEIPDVAQIVYHSRDKIFLTYEKMKGLLDRFAQVKSKIPNDLMVLLRTLVKRVEKSFMPGVTNINWSSFKYDEYFEYIGLHLDELEAIGDKIEDIMTVRVNQCLWDICHTMMIDIPVDRPLHVVEYLEKIHAYCRVVAKELEYKSRHCEAAVIELINILVATNELNLDDAILYGWMNPYLFGKGDKKDAESKTAVGRRRGGGRNENQMLIDMIGELSQTAKSEVNHLHEECRHVFMFYSQKCIEALQKTTRTSLDTLRRRIEEPQLNKRTPGKVDLRIPLLISDLILTIPTISLRPTLEESQKVLSRSVAIVMECLKHVVMWGQTRRTSFDATTDDSYFRSQETYVKTKEPVPYERLQAPDAYIKAPLQLENLNAKLKNCYKPVMDYKDVNKMVVIMQSVVIQTKPKVNAIIQKYMTYSYLWRTDRTDIDDFINQAPAITEVQAMMRSYNDLMKEISHIVPSHRIGPLEIFTHELRVGLTVEVKNWKTLLCSKLSEYYKHKAINISDFIEGITKDLVSDVKDLHSLINAMDNIAKVRERFVDDEALLTPIEECFRYLTTQNFKVTEEDMTRAEMLRYNFNLLQEKAMKFQNRVNLLENDYREKLLEAISTFQADLKKYLKKYREKGPMSDGLTPQDASDRLMMFQGEFYGLQDRYALCHEGERVFGLVINEYPEMNRNQKELLLLHKLYGLYNDVMRFSDGYNIGTLFDLDINKIMAEFRERCQKLPQAFKEWPAYTATANKLDELQTSLDAKAKPHAPPLPGMMQ